MKRLLIILSLLAVSLVSVQANEVAEQTLKNHWKHLMMANFDEHEKSYAEQVRLMPGHEFLKAKYGLTDKGRKKKLDVASSAVVKIFKDKFAKAANNKNRKLRIVGEKEAEAYLSKWLFDETAIKIGDMAVEPSDPVGTTDGLLHFQTIEGDVMIKVYPSGKKTDDHYVYQMRKIKGSWKIVAYYFD